MLDISTRPTLFANLILMMLKSVSVNCWLPLQSRLQLQSDSRKAAMPRPTFSGDVVASECTKGPTRQTPTR